MPAQAKYFIAVVPPEKIREKIELIKRELYAEHGLKGALRSPGHITLHRPFEWKENKEGFLIEKLEQFKFEKSFSIELKNYNCFEPRVIFIDVTKNDVLTNLHQRLTIYAKTRLKLFNEAEDMRGFHPHITIAFRDLKKQKFYELWNTFKTGSFSENFDFKGISLLKLGSKWEIIRDFNI
jgi:2'-5' RNA ligase